jgi:hypothetical protein
MEITEVGIQEFVDMLTGGDLPKGMLMTAQPSLTPEQAYSIVWYLQEHLRIIPDHLEMCHVCHTIFDTYTSGYTISDDPDDWYGEIGVSPEAVAKHEGTSFCSMECEIQFWNSFPDEEEDAQQAAAADPPTAPASGAPEIKPAGS